MSEEEPEVVEQTHRYRRVTFEVPEAYYERLLTIQQAALEARTGAPDSFGDFCRGLMSLGANMLLAQLQSTRLVQPATVVPKVELVSG